MSKATDLLAKARAEIVKTEEQFGAAVVANMDYRDIVGHLRVEIRHLRAALQQIHDYAIDCKPYTTQLENIVDMSKNGLRAGGADGAH